MAPTADESGKERKAFLVRLPPDLFAEIKAWASRDLRSMNAQIEYLLREAIKRRSGSEGSGTRRQR